MAVEQTPYIELPTEPVRLEEFKKSMENIDNIMTMRDAQGAALKEAIEGVFEEFDISKKMLRKLANARHKMNKDALVAEAEQIDSAYTSLWE